MTGKWIIPLVLAGWILTMILLAVVGYAAGRSLWRIATM